MIKKGFTLIELLVVIAIIAILAAILFPVFAQAKLAAKKTVAISNQKQIGLGIIMYSGDNDDLYPREDGCTLNDSMNAALDNVAAGTDPTPYCNGSANPGKYAFRDNHYSWQKWIMPYVKSRGLFFDPVQTPDPVSLNTYGELEGGYELNLAITGVVNSWGTASPSTRTSWIGGTQTSIPSPAEAMLVMEGPWSAVIPAMNVFSGNTAVSYPFAVQEHWAGYFYTAGGSGACGNTTTLNPAVAPYTGTLPLSYADGHTKAIPVGQFLANTPTSAQYGLGNPECTAFPGPNDVNYASVTITTAPVWTQPWPMWGLQ